MKILPSIEPFSGLWQVGRLLYCVGGANTFFYGSQRAVKIFWRFYWLSRMNGCDHFSMSIGKKEKK